MGHIICIGNQKGGVGKTTTAINLSAALSIAEKKILLVDSDPQGYATIGMGIDKTNISKNLYHGLRGEMQAADLITETKPGSIMVIPSRTELIRIDLEFASKPGKESLLKNLLKGLRDSYDYIIIDSPPSINLLLVNAMTAADSFLIPLQCEYYAFQGLGQLMNLFHIFKKKFNPQLRLEGILLTMFSPEEKVSREIFLEIKNQFKDFVLNTVIPRDNHLKESAYYKKPLAFRNIKSIGAKSYLDLANEIISKN